MALPRIITEELEDLTREIERACMNIEGYAQRAGLITEEQSIMITVSIFRPERVKIQELKPKPKQWRAKVEFRKISRLALKALAKIPEWTDTERGAIDKLRKYKNVPLTPMQLFPTRVSGYACMCAMNRKLKHLGSRYRMKSENPGSSWSEQKIKIGIVTNITNRPA